MTTQQVPPDPKEEAKKEMLHLRYWGSVWNIAHFVVGFCSAGIGAWVAATAKSTEASTVDLRLWMSAASAGLVFIITTFSPGKLGTAYRAASRHVNKAIIRFQAGTLNEQQLAEARAEAQDILKT